MFGIDIDVHWTFLLLLAWLFVVHMLAGEKLEVALKSVAVIVTLFACVILHELGHALVARHFGARTRSITLYPIGGVARLERIPERPREELLIALAGPFVSLAIAGSLSIFTALPRSADLWIAGGSFWGKIMYMNLSLGLFNLLPAFPMDGGRVLRALLALRIDRVRATQIAASAGRVASVLFGLVGIWTGQLMLVLIAVFVYVAAQQEAASVTAHAIMNGVRVREAMLPDFHSIDASLPLSAAVSVVLASNQDEFPVVDHGTLRGVLARSSLLLALAHETSETSIGALTTPVTATAAAAEPLEDAMKRLRDAGSSSLLVMDDGQLVGMLTLEHVAKWLTLRAALDHLQRHGAPSVSSHRHA